MKRVLLSILVVFSISSFAKDYKVGSDTLCSGEESVKRFKTLLNLGITKEEAYTRVKGCRALKTKSYLVGKNTECSDSKSKNAFQTLLNVGYDENYAYKKVPNCHPINSSKSVNSVTNEKRVQKGAKIYNFKGKEVYFRDSYYRGLKGKVSDDCFKTLSNGKYYYYMFERDRGNEVSFVMDARNPRQNAECPRYLIEKK